MNQLFAFFRKIFRREPDEPVGYWKLVVQFGPEEFRGRIYRGTKSGAEECCRQLVAERVWATREQTFARFGVEEVTEEQARELLKEARSMAPS